MWVKARHVQLREVSEDDNNETDYMMGTVIGSRWFIPGHTCLVTMVQCCCDH